MTSETVRIEKPHPDEYPAYAEMYMKLVDPDLPVLEQLARNGQNTIALLASLPEEIINHPLPPGHWTIKDTVCHLSDDERIYVYRALRFSRSDETVLPGFDQELFAMHAGAERRSIEDLLLEFESARAATISFFASLTHEALMKSGVADSKRSTVRALASHIAGHELHHIEILRKRYSLGKPSEL